MGAVNTFMGGYGSPINPQGMADDDSPMGSVTAITPSRMQNGGKAEYALAGLIIVALVTVVGLRASGIQALVAIGK